MAAIFACFYCGEVVDDDEDDDNYYDDGMRERTTIAMVARIFLVRAIMILSCLL
jgi:hypothetical protein